MENGFDQRIYRETPFGGVGLSYQFRLFTRYS